MAEADRSGSVEASYLSAYFRLLGVGAGNALKPVLLSLSNPSSGSEWERVRSSLETLNPWLARTIDELAIKNLPVRPELPEAAERGTSGRTHRNTSDHTGEKYPSRRRQRTAPGESQR